VPFLYQLLESDGAPDKSLVAHLLAHLADCESGEEEYMASTRQAVGKRLELLSSSLRDPEPEIRRSVAVAIGYFPDAVKRLLPDLELALRDESDEYAREALQAVIESQGKHPT